MEVPAAVSMLRRGMHVRIPHMCACMHARAHGHQSLFACMHACVHVHAGRRHARSLQSVTVTNTNNNNNNNNNFLLAACLGERPAGHVCVWTMDQGP